VSAPEEKGDGMSNRELRFTSGRARVLTALLFAAVLAPAAVALASDDPGIQCGPTNIFSDPNTGIGGHMCAQYYGLCIGAPCEGTGQVSPTGLEGDTMTIGGGLATEADIVEHALCKCPYINGNSNGKAPCDERAPDGVKSVSTYSFQFNNTHNRLLSCTQSNHKEDLRFADCYNQPCELDPADPTQVICKCPVFGVRAIPGQTYVTRGGDCQQEACEEKIWSGVPPQFLSFADDAVACGIGIPQPPDKFSCPKRSNLIPVTK
jgi:hypothetical protein